MSDDLENRGDNGLPGNGLPGNGLPGFGEREPLHQPPNADDLRRVPPGGPICARVRGWLRDYVDGDLSTASRRHVDEHCHVCRVCAVALARAEHEVLRLRRAFQEMGREQAVRGGGLGAGFADRVVDRLVRDETVHLRDIRLEGAPNLVARVVAAAARESSGVESGESAPKLGSERGASESSGLLRGRAARSPSGLLIACSLLLAAVVSLAVWLDGGDSAPQVQPRFVVTAAEFTYGDHSRPLESGDGLSEHETILVGADGIAKIDWHDASAMNQPAATLEMNGSSKASMIDGAPVLLGGKVRIDTNRPVTVAVGGGSRLDLGTGEYVVSTDAEAGLDWSGSDQYLPQMRDPYTGSPQDLRITVEVVRGDPAQIIRQQSATVTVSAGNVGIYQGGSYFTIRPTGGTTQGEQGVDARVASTQAPAPLAVLSGDVKESSGQPSAGTEILLAFASGGGVAYRQRFSNADGHFQLDLPAPPDSSFAIVHALPAAGNNLAISAPDAYRLLRSGIDVRIESDLLVPLSVPLTGVVKDQGGNERIGVWIVPCWIDELFGSVMPWTGGQTITDANGRFTVNRLPARLPHHQYLALLLLDPSLEPTVVPVPVRGSLAATAELPPIRMTGLRPIRIHSLVANTTYIIYEEVAGLPVGSAAWQRSVTSDGQGRVSLTNVGSGRLWLQNSNSTQTSLRELVVDDPTGTPRYRTAEGPAIERNLLFRPWQAIPGSSLLLANSYRHEHFVLSSQDQVNGRVMLAAHQTLGTAPGAQVFVVAASGPRSQVDARFLGFTSTTGVISLESVAEGESLFVIGADGSVGQMASPLDASMTVTVMLSPTGRVLLGPGLIPVSPLDAVRIRFEFLGPSVGGMVRNAYRFACQDGGWEVSGLPPGDYRAWIGDVPHPVTVPAVGFATLQ